MRWRYIFVIVLTGSWICAVPCGQANLIDWERYNQYMKQQEDASAGKKDIVVDDSLPLWAQVSPQAITGEEKRYDVNRDGTLSPPEMKVYLRRVYEQIQRDLSKLVADSQALREYDRNKDGVISQDEAQRIKKDAF